MDQIRDADRRLQCSKTVDQVLDTTHDGDHHLPGLLYRGTTPEVLLLVRDTTNVAHRLLDHRDQVTTQEVRRLQDPVTILEDLLLQVLATTHGDDLHLTTCGKDRLPGMDNGDYEPLS